MVYDQKSKGLLDQMAEDGGGGRQGAEPRTMVCAGYPRKSPTCTTSGNGFSVH